MSWSAGCHTDGLSLVVTHFWVGNVPFRDENSSQSQNWGTFFSKDICPVAMSDEIIVACERTECRHRSFIRPWAFRVKRRIDRRVPLIVFPFHLINAGRGGYPLKLKVVKPQISVREEFWEI